MALRTTSFCVIALFGLAGCTTMDAQIRSSGTMGQVDADYAKVSYDLEQFDIQAGKLAATRAGDARVSSLASNLTDQATAFTPQLQPALTVQGIALPTTLPAGESAEIKKLSGLNKSAFDREYVDYELALHTRAVAALQAESDKTNDGALRLQAQTQLPAVQMNMSTLQMLSSEYKGNTTG